jgi:hypothetical protein
MARTKALTCYGMSYRGACSLLLVIAQAACVGWCDIHANARPLVGGYHVTNADGWYYLERGPEHFGTGRVVPLLDGRIDQLGWSERVIVARRLPNKGGSPEWMIVNVQTHAIEGPFSEEDWLHRSETRQDLRGLVVRRIDDA